MFGTRAGNHLIALMARHAPATRVRHAAGRRRPGQDELAELTAHVFADPTKREFVLGLAATVSHHATAATAWRTTVLMPAAITDLRLQDEGPSCWRADATPTSCPSTPSTPPVCSRSQRIDVALGTHLAASRPTTATTSSTRSSRSSGARNLRNPEKALTQPVSGCGMLKAHQILEQGAWNRATEAPCFFLCPPCVYRLRMETRIVATDQQPVALSSRTGGTAAARPRRAHRPG